jgi:hypothetical protein
MEITKQARDEISKFNQLQASALARTGTHNQLTFYNQSKTKTNWYLSFENSGDFIPKVGLYNLY